MNIRLEAFRVAEVVARFVERARAFFYDAALCGRRCPRCGSSVAMTGEGKAKCTLRGHRLDPTVAFQPCPSCGGPAKLRVRRYQCQSCDEPITSRFLFDGLIFDAAYFRRKMAEHRQRDRERRERVRQVLAMSRSDPVPAQAVDLTGIPGLIDALNSLSANADSWSTYESRTAFDLARYQSHIQAHIRAIAVNFDQIPPLSEDERLDRVWRFIALIFLAHAGLVRLEQDNGLITIHEAHPEGQDVPGDFEAADGVEGLAG